MLPFRCAAATVLCSVVSITATLAPGQEQNARALVRSIVSNELKVDANEHALWIYRDAHTVNGKSTVKLVVQIPEGDVSKIIEMNGHPLTVEQQKTDEQKMHRFVTDPAVRQKQKQNRQQNDKRVASMMKMLPDAFLWTKTGQSGDETTLAFSPDPKFHPPTREARVLAAMKGTMVVNTKQKRIKSLKGTLIKNVNFGFGLLGQLQKGGTFDVGRQNIGDHVWKVTAAHIRIHGRALIFKSISAEQDEETSNYKPAPQFLTLADAAKMLNDGSAAKTLGLAEP